MNKTVIVNMLYPVGKKVFLIYTILNNFKLVYNIDFPTTIHIMAKIFDTKSNLYYAYIKKYENNEIFDLLVNYIRIHNE